jgi:isopenicillin-N N-acyltransferase like protein
VLRDVLQFDSSLDESIKRMQSTRRTCNLILGVGSGKDGQFRGFQYSHSHANVIAPDNLKPVNSTWHEAIPDVVYWGMDWLCPPFSKRLSEMIKANYGTITAESTISSILPGTHTGNLQAVSTT